MTPPERNWVSCYKRLHTTGNEVAWMVSSPRLWQVQHCCHHCSVHARIRLSKLDTLLRLLLRVCQSICKKGLDAVYSLPQWLIVKSHLRHWTPTGRLGDP